MLSAFIWFIIIGCLIKLAVDSIIGFPDFIKKLRLKYEEEVSSSIHQILGLIHDFKACEEQAFFARFTPIRPAEFGGSFN